MDSGFQALDFEFHAPDFGFQSLIFAGFQKPDSFTSGDCWERQRSSGRCWIPKAKGISLLPNMEPVVQINTDRRQK